MRLRIHHPLFAGFIGVIGMLVLLVVVLTGRGFRRELTEANRSALERELGLAVSLVEALPDLPPQDVARRITSQLGYRITLIGEDGRVLGDSDVRADRLAGEPNQADRPEVVAALAGGLPLEVTEAEGAPYIYGARRVTLQGRPAVLRIATPLTTVDAAVSRTRRVVVLAGLAALVLAVVVAYGLSRALARPLVVLADRVRGLASGDFSQRAPRNMSVAELDDLGAAFNRLTDELRARLSELGRERDEMQALIDAMAEGVVALTEDARILRTNRAARALLALPHTAAFAPVGAMVRHPDLRDLLEESVVKPFQAREVAFGNRHLIVTARLLDQGGSVVTFLDVSEMRRLEQVRRDFVANASHELKTPLTTIRGFAETLLEDDPPDALRKEFLTSIRDNTLRLQRMVEDLLDLSRLESGAWSARREEVDLEGLAIDAWSDFRERAAAGGVAFSVTGSALVMADEQGLRQIFRNLLENSMRYTGQGGSITVRIMAPGTMARVDVADTGAGISSRSLPRIFERFYRADTSRARAEGGTGLGLAIVRHLVQEMGGEVGAESELGQGTTIWFTLPLAVLE
ncbi:MAG: HAMP domain-containing sensor histidine kinase [Gemmatimonadetes bacterium]|nr:HAMP domain-containing sensor histidine kinase [Gemmatimonadota bacterium]